MKRPAVEFRGVTKRFGEVQANSNLNFQIESGTIHGIIGENGAGKSTAMKILANIYKPDAGEIHVSVSGREIGMVHQHFMLAGPFDAVDNVIIGHPGPFDRSKVRRELEALAKQTGFELDLQIPIEDLPLGMQQRLEILKLLYTNCKILILDEPTAVLTPQEVQTFFVQIRKLKEQGKTILFITHKLKEILAVADAVSVFRAGQCVATLSVKDTNAEQLSELMVGKKLNPTTRKTRGTSESVFRLGGPWDLTLESGKILGIAGVDGNGQKELFETLIQERQPGMAFLPEDRLRDAVIPGFSLKEHFQLGSKARRLDSQFLKEFDIRPADPNLELESLSGGNQQKFIVARELSTSPKILIAYHPTRGVDLGAAARIHENLKQLADDGTAILLVSTELDELFELSDELKVLYRGRINATFQPSTWSESKVGQAMAGIP